MRANTQTAESVQPSEKELTEAGIMGLIISAAGAAVMVLGIVLFILQAGKISRIIESCKLQKG